MCCSCLQKFKWNEYKYCLPINNSLSISVRRFYLTWFIGLAGFFWVLKVISDITHWGLLVLFVGIVCIINSGSDLCVRERIMHFDMIPILTYLWVSSEDMSHVTHWSLAGWIATLPVMFLMALYVLEVFRVVVFMSTDQTILCDSGLYFGRTVELVTRTDWKIYKYYLPWGQIGVLHWFLHNTRKIKIMGWFGFSLILNSI